jgi:hypothetical protein
MQPRRWCGISSVGVPEYHGVLVGLGRPLAPHGPPDATSHRDRCAVFRGLGRNEVDVFGQGEALSECVASARDVESIVLLRPVQGGQKYVLGSVIVDETGVVHATAQREGPYAPSYSAYWSVYVDLTAEAADAFQAATEAAVGSLDPQNQIAIIVEGRILSSPTVAAPITSGNVVLTGSFTKTQARLLASNLSGSG